MPANLRTLGRTDIRVSPVAMGCWAIVGDSTWGTQDETDAINALKAAHDCGINHFDTAEGYGAGYSEELVGKALRDVRDQIVIASKVSPNHAGTWDDLQKACDASLRYLQTDVIDVYYLHWPNRDVPTDEIIANFARLRDAGKIRAFAVSNFGKGDLTEGGHMIAGKTLGDLGADVVKIEPPGGSPSRTVGSRGGRRNCPRMKS